MIRDYILFDGFTIIILLNVIIVTIAKTLNNSKFKQFLFIYLNNSFLKFLINPCIGHAAASPRAQIV